MFCYAYFFCLFVQVKTIKINPMRSVLFIILVSFGLVFMQACSDDNNSNNPGGVVLNVVFKDGKFIINTKQTKASNINGVYLSINDDAGNSVMNLERITLLQIGDQFISEYISLQEGDYTLEDFLIVNNEDSVLFIAPKEGSTYAHLVQDPLAINFEVIADNENTVNVEVLPASYGNASEYGYTAFGVNIIDPLQVGLIVHFPFDGDFQEYGSENFPFQVSGVELVSDMNGEPESAAYFNGLGDHINLNNDEPVITGNTFTIAAWVNNVGEGGGVSPRNIIFQQRDDDATGETSKSTIVFASEDRFLRVSFAARSSQSLVNLVENEALPRNEWHHYTATLDEEKNMKVYVDGFLVSQSYYDYFGDFVTSVDHVDIGIQQYFGGQLQGALNGCMDDFRIYNRALSQKEIRDIISVNE